MLEIRLTPGAVVYQEIADAIRMAVARGTLQPGDRLEPVRDLAVRLGVNVSTVARAYRMLEQAGVIETNRRRGSVIAAGAGAASGAGAVRDERLHLLIERALIDALAQGYTPDEVEAAIGLGLGAWRERRLNAPGGPGAPSSGERPFRFAGSHDLALEALWTRLRRAHAEINLASSYVGSLPGLLALLRGEADLAGAHVLDEESGEYNLPALRRLFGDRPLCVIALAERAQGLIVPPHNPAGVTRFADLARPGLRFINRQAGSGTRTLLDYHLRRLGVAPAAVAGYDREVATHLAVAAAVADGSADVGLGLLAAARAFGLDFVPLARERYDLVLRSEDHDRTPWSWIIDLVRSPAFRAVEGELGGYGTTHSGEERWLP